MDGPKGALSYKTSNPYGNTLSRIAHEVVAARQQFPDPSGSMTALTEEVGELAKALLDEPWSRVEAEAIQVAAMAIRVLEEGDPTLSALRSARVVTESVGEGE